MSNNKFQSTLSLKPTQFSVGLVEIACRVHKLGAMKRGKLDKLIKRTEIPLVLSPRDEMCIIDHHHFVFACWQLGVKQLKVKVVKDYSRSKFTHLQFWKTLSKRRYAYLYDQFGSGPRNALYLPIDVRGMADDPYRSLAWLIKKEGGFEDSELPFAEFQWADFFRENRLLDSQGRAGFKRAVAKGTRLARSAKARLLPGYLAADTDARVGKKFRKTEKYLKVALS